MNYMDLIAKLRDTSQALEELARHLGELQQTGESTENSTEVMSNSISVEIIADDEALQTTVPADAATTQTAADTTPDTVPQTPAAASRPHQPPLANMLGNLLRGGMPGVSGGIPGLPGLNLPGLPNLAGLMNPGGSLPGVDMQNMPKSLEELQANPQLMSMLDSVRNNPHMLNMISSLSGLDTNKITQALQSIQPQAAATPAQSAAATADIMRTTPQAAVQLPQLAAQTMPQTAAPRPVGHLDSLLSEWRWQPYARVWSC